MDKTNKKIREAISISIENVESNKGGPFGAVIVDNDTNKIVSTGANSVIRNTDPTAHAEIVAIRNACTIRKSPFLENCTIYSSCEPCPMCYGAIKWAKIQNIYYANTRTDAKRIGFSDEEIYDDIIHRRQNMVHIEDTEEAIKAFKIWEKSEKKILY